MLSKRHAVVANTKIYLGTPWFNEIQKERVEQATIALDKNPTVQVIHFPFDHQYKDATVENQNGVFGSLEWQMATYQNDLSAMESSDAGVFLYDMDDLDDGSAFEVGFLRALHKPVILIPLCQKPITEYKMNLMLARGVTAFLDKIDDLTAYDFNHMLTNPMPKIEVF